MADQEQDPLFRYAYFCIQLVKERFRNQESKLMNLRLILEEGTSGEIDMDTLLYKLSVQLGDENEDLLQKLKSFIPVEKTKIGRTVKSCCDLLNLARSVLKADKKKYDLFVDEIIGFGKHKDVNRLKRKTSPVLIEHRSLDLAFSKFIKSHDIGRRSKKYVRSDNDGHEKKLFECQDDMHESDISRHRFMSVVESATALIQKNLGQNEEEEISVGEYFSVLNLAFVRDNLIEKHAFLSSKRTRLEAIMEVEDMINKLLMKYEKFDRAHDLNKAKWTRIIRENTVTTKRPRRC